MKMNYVPNARKIAGILGIIALSGVAHAQYFTASDGDLLLGFRTTNSSSYDLVVNIGSVTNFLALSPGTTVAVSNFSSMQLSNAFTRYSTLAWSVSASGSSGVSPWAGFPASTIWSSRARSSTNAQTTPPVRQSSTSQGQARQRVYGVGVGANTISTGLPSTGVNNNQYLVREPYDTSGNTLTYYIADPNDNTIGDFQGQWYNVENITPASFTADQRSDLYQSCPSGKTDPITMLMSGNAYYIGYFDFAPSGAMTFTRASVTPPAPTISLQLSSTNATISFPTTSGATYTLYYTNLDGLTSARSTWATSSTNLTGDGTVRSFSDSLTPLGRVYSVGAH